MRNFAVALMAATLLAGNALADSAPSLPAGKPAGLRTAQDNGDNTIFYIVGLGAIGAGIAILASGNSNGSTSPATAPSTQ